MRLKAKWIALVILVALVSVIPVGALIIEIRIFVQQRYIKRSLEKIEGLSDEERAQEVWRLLLEMRRGNWHRNHWHHGILCRELRQTGDAGKRLLFNTIRHGPKDSRWEAMQYIPRDAEAFNELLAILREEDEYARHVALVALVRFSTRRLSPEDKKRLREGVSPMLTHDNMSVREEARMIIMDLDDQQP